MNTSSAGWRLIPWYTNEPPPTPAPHMMSMPSPRTRSSNPVNGSQAGGETGPITGEHIQEIRSSGRVAWGNVSALGPVGQRIPRSRTSTGTPAAAKRSAATPPPNPDPMTTTRCSSLVSGTRPPPAAPTRDATPTDSPVATAPARNWRRLIVVMPPRLGAGTITCAFL